MIFDQIFVIFVSFVRNGNGLDSGGCWGTSSPTDTAALAPRGPTFTADLAPKFPFLLQDGFGRR